ncbi:hypothetical protein NYO98_10365 [Nocardioides sp. STR2]|uniref:Uncharacterized protein n=1 Tax=Nocardioides pini TaxID=2975053 RepID=A0ABT4CCJ4_9ACTN|nr:hypothetical protein [Nocardioides pini]MCY4726681.1 hypothetical protein [Nocardioides pini]
MSEHYPADAIQTVTAAIRDIEGVGTRYTGLDVDHDENGVRVFLWDTELGGPVTWSGIPLTVTAAEVTARVVGDLWDRA